MNQYNRSFESLVWTEVIVRFNFYRDESKKSTTCTLIDQIDQVSNILPKWSKVYKIDLIKPNQPTSFQYKIIWKALELKKLGLWKLGSWFWWSVPRRKETWCSHKNSFHKTSQNNLAILAWSIFHWPERNIAGATNFSGNLHREKWVHASKLITTTYLASYLPIYIREFLSRLRRDTTIS